MVEYNEKQIAFHRNRIMFCIRGDKVEVAQFNDPRSHIQWFKDEGWSEADEEVFLAKTTRGMYHPDSNSLFCYYGYGHIFDLDIIWDVKKHIQQLKTALNLKGETKINFGPKDKYIEGVEHNQLFWGTLSEMERRVNIQNLI